jgi:hypothetical protein
VLSQSWNFEVCKLQTGTVGCFWDVMKLYTLYLTVLTVRSSKAPDTRPRAQSTPPGAPPGRCSHSCCYSPLPRDTDVQYRDARTHGTGRTLVYTVRIYEHTAPSGHLFTLSGYMNTRHRADTCLHCANAQTYCSPRTLSRNMKACHRPDTYRHSPET